MFRPNPAVITDDGSIIFVKSKRTGKPIPYVKLDPVLIALDAINMGGETLRQIRNEALVELAQYVKENDF